MIVLCELILWFRSSLMTLGARTINLLKMNMRMKVEKHTKKHNMRQFQQAFL